MDREHLRSVLDQVHQANPERAARNAFSDTTTLRVFFAASDFFPGARHRLAASWKYEDLGHLTDHIDQEVDIIDFTLQRAQTNPRHEFGQVHAKLLHETRERLSKIANSARYIRPTTPLYAHGKEYSRLCSDARSSMLHLCQLALGVHAQDCNVLCRIPIPARFELVSWVKKGDPVAFQHIKRISDDGYQETPEDKLRRQPPLVRDRLRRLSLAPEFRASTGISRAFLKDIADVLKAPYHYSAFRDRSEALQAIFSDASNRQSGGNIWCNTGQALDELIHFVESDAKYSTSPSEALTAALRAKDLRRGYPAASKNWFKR